MKHLTKPHTMAEIGMPVYEYKLTAEKLMERDYFLDAQQALEMGLVDKVLTSREEQEQAMAPLKDDKSDKGNDDDGSIGRDGGKGGDDGGRPPSPSVNPSPS
jgi:hypothetical protein